MTVTIQRATLIKPLQMISGVVEKRQTMPILSNVLISVHEQNLSLTATDLDIELIGSTSLDQTFPSASTTVSAKKLLDICRAFPDEAILELTPEKEHLVLRCGASRFMLAALPACDFPNIEGDVVSKVQFPLQFTISQSKLRKLINKTYFAMGQQDVRHYLNGALFIINQGVATCVATDGHRLAFSSMNDVNGDDTTVKVVVPRKSVLELMRLLDQNSEELMTVCVGESHFRVISSDFTFTSKLINAQYPDYNKLIPRDSVNIATASREAVKQALIRASILSNEKYRGIRLHFDQGKLRMVANNPEQEEAEETIDLVYEGNGLEMGFNAAYLLDVVSAIASDTIRFSFTDSNSGVVIESTEMNDSLYVVMPMRL